MKKIFPLKLGTRGSRLALWQADFVAGELQKAHADIRVECKTIKTRGDGTLDALPSRVGDKGLFTGEIEKELLAGSIDIAVHSLKDLPTCLEPGLRIGAVLKRENPLDVILSEKGYTFTALPPGATLGTSSLRRAAQIKAARPDIFIEPLRGNVETRIKKMTELGLDGIVLAYAGVRRLGFEKMITEVFSPDIMVPAVGQGALAVEIREADSEVHELLQAINNADTYAETLAERAFLHTLHGGCQVPIGCLAQLKEDLLFIQGLISSLDGRKTYKACRSGKREDAAALGKQLAEQLLHEGAEKILREILVDNNCYLI